MKRRAKLHAARPNMSDVKVQDEQGTGGIKRERRGKLETLTTRLEGQLIKKGKWDKDGSVTQYFEVVGTSRDWSQRYK